MRAVTINIKSGDEFIVRGVPEVVYKINDKGEVFNRHRWGKDWKNSSLSLFALSELDIEPYTPEIEWSLVPRGTDVYVRDDCTLDMWQEVKFLIDRRTMGIKESCAMFPFMVYDDNGNVSNFRYCKIKGQIKDEWRKYKEDV